MRLLKGMFVFRFVGDLGTGDFGIGDLAIGDFGCGVVLRLLVGVIDLCLLIAVCFR